MYTITLSLGILLSKSNKYFKFVRFSNPFISDISLSLRFNSSKFIRVSSPSITSILLHLKFNIFLQKINYTQKTATIKLTIIKRNINYILGNNFIKSGIEYKVTVLKGNNVILLINLTDPTSFFIPLENASIILTIGGNNYEFKEIEEGIYKYEFLTDNINVFFEPISLKGVITITKEIFDPEVIKITIVVVMLEIFPGMPFFYFLNIIVPFFIIISGLILYRYRLNKRRKD